MTKEEKEELKRWKDRYKEDIQYMRRQIKIMYEKIAEYKKEIKRMQYWIKTHKIK